MGSGDNEKGLQTLFIVWLVMSFLIAAVYGSKLIGILLAFKDEYIPFNNLLELADKMQVGFESRASRETGRHFGGIADGGLPAGDSEYGDGGVGGATASAAGP